MNVGFKLHVVLACYEESYEFDKYDKNIPSLKFLSSMVRKL